MALDTFESIAGKVRLRCSQASILLTRDWVANAFRRVAERRPWSWLIKQGQFVLAASYSTGTVTCVQGSTTVTGSGTVWTTAMVDRQFRLSVVSPIYTITAVDEGLQTLTLDIAWGPASTADSTYEIYTAYRTPPSDFNYFLTVWDPNYNWQLHINLTQRELNNWDAQRSNRGQAYLIASRDFYTPSGETVPLPRFEVWPHVLSAYVIPFLYVARATDLEDSGATLPRFIRGDILLEMALAEAARWPGPELVQLGEASPRPSNPYFNLNLAQMHETKAEFMIQEVERQDEEIMLMNVSYDTAARLPWAPLPLDSDYWQKHAL